MKAQPDNRKKIEQALTLGNVECTERVQHALANFDFHNPDRTLTNASVYFWGPSKHNSGGLGIDWMTVSAGCGRSDFYLKDEQLCCYNQDMSKEFLGALLEYVVNNIELADRELREARFSSTDFTVNFWGTKDSVGAGMAIEWRSAPDQTEKLVLCIENNSLRCNNEGLTRSCISKIFQSLLALTVLE